MDINEKVAAIKANVPEVYAAGERKGYNDGTQDSYKKCYDEGYSAGQSEGYTEGYGEGKNAGYNEGYDKGLADGETDLTELLDTQNDFIVYQGYDDMLHLAVGEDGKTVFNKIGYAKFYNTTTGVSEYLTGYMPKSAALIKNITFAENQSVIMTLYEEIGSEGMDVTIYDIGLSVDYDEKGNITSLGYTLEDPFGPDYKYMRLHFADITEAPPIIAAKIHREFDGKTDLEDAIGNVPRVYEAGRESFYDEFWDNFQNYGKRTVYNYAFDQSTTVKLNGGWNDKTCNPKYPITIVQGDGIWNNNKDITRINQIIDATKCVGGIAGICTGCTGLTFIKKIIAHKNLTYVNSFHTCSKLENITFEGDIGTNISFQWSPLTAKSAKSVITHLFDYSADATKAYAYTVNFSDTTLALLEAEGNTAPNGGTWLEYIDSLGWNV